MVDILLLDMVLDAVLVDRGPCSHLLVAHSAFILVSVPPVGGGDDEVDLDVLQASVAEA